MVIAAIGVARQKQNCFSMPYETKHNLLTDWSTRINEAVKWRKGITLSFDEDRGYFLLVIGKNNTGEHHAQVCINETT